MEEDGSALQDEEMLITADQIFVELDRSEDIAPGRLLVPRQMPRSLVRYQQWTKNAQE
jgi:hypothetical protein